MVLFPFYIHAVRWYSSSACVLVGGRHGGNCHIRTCLPSGTPPSLTHTEIHAHSSKRYILHKQTESARVFWGDSSRVEKMIPNKAGNESYTNVDNNGCLNFINDFSNNNKQK